MIFLIDDNNTRVLFEKVLSSMPNEKARFVDENNNLMTVFFLVQRTFIKYYFCVEYIQAGKTLVQHLMLFLNIIIFFLLY